MQKLDESFSIIYQILLTLVHFHEFVFYFLELERSNELGGILDCDYEILRIGTFASHVQIL